jgi:hypothetical protein
VDAPAYFTILFQHFPVELKKITNTSVRVSGLRTEIETQDISYIILKSLAPAMVFASVFVCNTVATASVLLMVDSNNVLQNEF